MKRHCSFILFSLSLSLCLHVLIYRLSICLSCSALRLFYLYLYPDLDLINHSCVIHCISQLHDFSISLTPSLSIFYSLPLYHTFIISSFLLPFPYFESDIYMSIIQSSLLTSFTDYISPSTYLSHYHSPTAPSIAQPACRPKPIRTLNA